MSISIAIIPARAGSKRLPGKNIKLLANKPLISWTIEAALDSNVFDKVIVSTDSLEIKEIAENFGAEVPYLRPSHLATDEASSGDVILDTVNYFESQGCNIDTITLLQPTSPLRTSSHIREAFELKSRKDAKAIVSVCQVEHSLDVCNILPLDDSLCNFVTKENVKRSQEHKVYYRINGAIYIFKKEFLPDLSTLYTSSSYAYKMDRISSVDIDDENDFNYAEFLISRG